MAKIAVVTDSVATIPVDLVKKYNIYVAPVHIIWDKVDYRDSVDLQTSEFYTRLRKSKTLPTTSSAIQGEFLQIIEGLKGKVESIVILHLSGDMGTIRNAALLAKETNTTGIPVEIVDTRSGMMAQGFSVLAAAKVAAEGGNMSDVIKAAEQVIPKTHIFWAMDTLEYIRKGGRISLPQAILATWLQVKPITGFVDGKVQPLARVRTKAKVMDKLLELMDERITHNSPLHVSVIHGDAAEEAEQLEQKVNARYKPAELIRSEVTPVIGTHTGPGTLGLAFYNE
jgi:DegV family protein with EDD domain